jgi:hypothetical protein
MKALFTRILSIGKGKGKEKKRKEKSSVRLVEGEGGKSWQNTSGTTVVTGSAHFKYQKTAPIPTLPPVIISLNNTIHEQGLEGRLAQSHLTTRLRGPPWQQLLRAEG